MRLDLVLQEQTHPSIFIALTGLAGSGKSSQLLHLPITLEEQARFQPDDEAASIISNSMSHKAEGGPLLFVMDLKEAGDLPDPAEVQSVDQAAAMMLLAAFLGQRGPRESINK